MKKGKDSSWADKLQQLPYDRLEKYIATGDEKLLDSGLTKYIDQLSLVRQSMEKYKSQDEIVRLLRLTYPELSPLTCRQIYGEAINFFYSDIKIKKKALRALLASRLETLFFLALEKDELENARRIIQTQSEMLQLDIPDEPEGELDPLRNDSRPIIYTADPKLLGVASKTNIAELKRKIKQWGLTKAEQNQVLNDADPDAPLRGFEDEEE